MDLVCSCGKSWPSLNGTSTSCTSLIMSLRGQSGQKATQRPPYGNQLLFMRGISGPKYFLPSFDFMQWSILLLLSNVGVHGIQNKSIHPIIQSERSLKRDHSPLLYSATSQLKASARLCMLKWVDSTFLRACMSSKKNAVSRYHVPQENHVLGSSFSMVGSCCMIGESCLVGGNYPWLNYPWYHFTASGKPPFLSCFDLLICQINILFKCC